MFILSVLLFFLVVMGINTIMERRDDQIVQTVHSTLNVPFGISVLGCVLTLIMLILQLQPATLSLPIFNHVFGATFYIDAISAFFAFTLFSCGILFFSLQKNLHFDVGCISLYIVAALVFLSGDLYFIAYSLAIFMMVLYGGVSGKTLCPLIGLTGLLGTLAIIPNTLNDQKEFALLTFNFLKNQSFSAIFIFFIFLISWSLLGFFPCFKWRMQIAKQGKGTTSYSFRYLLMSLIGIYILFRFWLDIGKGNMNYISFMLLEIIAVIAAIWAGWKALVVSTIYERIHCLFILANASLVQMIILVPVLHTINNNEWLPFAYDGLQIGLYVQLLGFSLASIYIDDINILTKNNCDLLSITIPSEIIISLLLLSFLLSGFPPFIGFIAFWINLQLLMVIPSFYQWFGILLATFFVSMNGIVLILSIIGWLRLILTGGLKSLQQAFYGLQSYFSSSKQLQRKICLAFIFLLSVVPGFLFLISKDITNTLTGKVNSNYGFFTFQALNYRISLNPLFIILLFMVIFAIIELIVRKERKKYPLFVRHTKIEHQNYDAGKVETTSFNFGQASFQLMLELRFPFLKSFTSLFYWLWRKVTIFKIQLQLMTDILNHFIWKNQDRLLLIIIGMSLLSIGLIAR